MNIKTTFIFILIILIVGQFLYYDYKTDQLESQLNTVQPPDTVTITIQPESTETTTVADTTVVEIEISGDTVYVHKILEDHVSFPLFDLDVKVQSKTAEFTYKIDYKPLTISLMINDPYDIRKGFEVQTDPPISNITTDFGTYKPVKLTKFSLDMGFGYSKLDGPMLMAGIKYKRNFFGVFAKEGSYGLMYLRSIWNF